jgi:hypothetical protein
MRNEIENNEENDEENDVGQTVLFGLEKRAARQATAKAIEKSAAKTGLKVAGKVGGKVGGKYLAPPVGVALGVAEAAPIVWTGLKGQARRAKEASQRAYSAAKAGRYVEAGKEAARGAAGAFLDSTTTTAKAGVAFLTSKEVAELIPTRKNGKKMKYAITNMSVAKSKRQARRNPGIDPNALNSLLSLMLALRTAYLYLHWNATTYAEHLQYERIYQTLDADIDTLAELSVAEIHAVAPTGATVADVERAEHAVQQKAQDIINVLSGAKTPNQSALENFLMTLIENRQRALYLLRLKG